MTTTHAGRDVTTTPRPAPTPPLTIDEKLTMAHYVMDHRLAPYGPTPTVPLTPAAPAPAPTVLR